MIQMVMLHGTGLILVRMECSLESIQKILLTNLVPGKASGSSTNTYNTMEEIQHQIFTGHGIEATKIYHQRKH